MVAFFTGRPIFASAVAVVMVMAGAICYVLLPVAQFPDITPPQVVVSATYPGASAEVVADTVTTPLEQQINGVAGHDLHVLDELERRLLNDHGHLQRWLSVERSPRSTCRIAWLAGRLVPAGDRQPGRCDDQEAESRTSC